MFGIFTLSTRLLHEQISSIKFRLLFGSPGHNAKLGSEKMEVLRAIPFLPQSYYYNNARDGKQMRKKRTWNSRWAIKLFRLANLCTFSSVPPQSHFDSFHSRLSASSSFSFNSHSLFYYDCCSSRSSWEVAEADARISEDRSEYCLNFNSKTSERKRSVVLPSGGIFNW